MTSYQPLPHPFVPAGRGLLDKAVYLSMRRAWRIHRRALGWRGSDEDFYLSGCVHIKWDGEWPTLRTVLPPRERP